MTAFALIVALTLLTALAVLQLLVAVGLPYGRYVWGGEHRVLPRRLRIGSFVTIPVYLCVAVLLLSRAGVLPGGSSGFVVISAWVIFALFASSVLTNAISRSAAERWTMAPASAVLAVATFIIALD